MSRRLIAVLLMLCMLLTACGAAPQNPTEGSSEPSGPTQTETTQPAEEEEEEVDLFVALFPEDDNVPKKKEFVRIVKELAENTSRISEVTYTWKNGKTSMEVLSGVYDEYHVNEGPEESPLQLVYGESAFYNYVLYLPEGYDPADTQTKWPVIYFFHGIGESGNALLEQANRYLAESEAEDAESLDRESFCALLAPESIIVMEDGSFQFLLDGGDLFWGQTIQVSGTLDEGVTDAVMEG